MCDHRSPANLANCQPAHHADKTTARHELFGHPGLFVVDASAIPVNLGVNPSLTITALAERFASLIPPADAAEPDPVWLQIGAFRASKEPRTNLARPARYEPSDPLFPSTHRHQTE